MQVELWQLSASVPKWYEKGAEKVQYKNLLDEISPSGVKKFSSGVRRFLSVY